MDYTDILEKLSQATCWSTRSTRRRTRKMRLFSSKACAITGKTRKSPGRAGRGGVITYTSIENKPKY